MKSRTIEILHAARLLLIVKKFMELVKKKIKHIYSYSHKQSIVELKQLSAGRYLILCPSTKQQAIGWKKETEHKEHSNLALLPHQQGALWSYPSHC